jgi:plasmid maintenance system antidote protein VapI
MKKNKIDTPGTYLNKLLDMYNISYDELIKYALITKYKLDNIINGNELIPLSLAQYLKINYNIPISWWQILNDTYCIANNRKYVGINTAHEMLLNAIIFEK